MSILNSVSFDIWDEIKVFSQNENEEMKSKDINRQQIHASGSFKLSFLDLGR